MEGLDGLKRRFESLHDVFSDTIRRISSSKVYKSVSKRYSNMLSSWYPRRRHGETRMPLPDPQSRSERQIRMGSPRIMAGIKCVFQHARPIWELKRE
jgi:hypothetical protein